jgi:DsbC/DsbD-like thiol-disulfide interchange protein
MRLILACVALFAAFTAPAAAQDGDFASAWAKSHHSAVRLIAGGRTPDGGYRIGVEIKLAGTFKTYWRVPGDAGVPPIFDWSSSENAGSVALRWPAPQRFVDAGVTTIGYKDRVIFPAVVRAADAAKPTTITLQLDYAVCDRICIPAKASATLRLPEAAETRMTADLDGFRARAPRLLELGKANGGLGLASAAWAPDKARPAVDLSITLAAGASLADAFLEGPDGWHFGAPQQVMIEADKIQLRVPVEDRPKNAVGVIPVVLTLAGSPHAAEVRFDLDISAGKQ